MSVRVRKAQRQQSIPATWQEAVEKYLLYKKAQGLRPTTLRGQRDAISIFFRRYPGAYRATDPSPAVFAYMGEPIRPATYNMRRAYLKQFFDWCIAEGVYTSNPLVDLKTRKDPGRVVSLEPELLRTLLAMPDRKTFAGLRDYAMLILTLDTGIRPKEACSLLKGDFDFAALEVHIRPEVAKTGVARTLPLSAVTVSVIQDLIKARHPKWNDHVPVICTAEGTPMDKDSWNDRMELYSKRLGVKIRPYDLRHAFALQYLRNGGNALALQRIMGHSDLSMTKRYVAMTQGDLRQQHDQVSPLSTILPNHSRVRKLKPRQPELVSHPLELENH
ncbi:MAG: tyrosine-type recombinase/integrase [Betaproteobacteria bacterium]